MRVGMISQPERIRIQIGGVRCWREIATVDEKSIPTSRGGGGRGSLHIVCTQGRVHHASKRPGAQPVLEHKSPIPCLGLQLLEYSCFRALEHQYKWKAATQCSTQGVPWGHGRELAAHTAPAGSADCLAIGGVVEVTVWAVLCVRA